MDITLEDKEETKRVLDQVSDDCHFHGPLGIRPLNAYVAKSNYRLEIYLPSGEWLGVDLENVYGDESPFCS